MTSCVPDGFPTIFENLRLLGREPDFATLLAYFISRRFACPVLQKSLPPSKSAQQKSK